MNCTPNCEKINKVASKCIEYQSFSKIQLLPGSKRLILNVIYISYKFP